MMHENQENAAPKAVIPFNRLSYQMLRDSLCYIL